MPSYAQRRKSKVQPSQVSRKKKRAKRQPGQRYTTSAVGQAIRQGIDKANAARACPACKERPAAERCPACQVGAVPHWHVHQLRHTAATRIRREYGLDTARVVLGHRSPAVTALYAEADAGRAAEVMGKLG